MISAGEGLKESGTTSDTTEYQHFRILYVLKKIFIKTKCIFTLLSILSYYIYTDDIPRNDDMLPSFFWLVLFLVSFFFCFVVVLFFKSCICCSDGGIEVIPTYPIPQGKFRVHIFLFHDMNNNWQ